MITGIFTTQADKDHIIRQVINDVMRASHEVILPQHFYYSDLTHDFELLRLFFNEPGLESGSFEYLVRDMGTDLGIYGPIRMEAEGCKYRASFQIQSEHIYLKVIDI